jgi:hypothetical protein
MSCTGGNGASTVNRGADCCRRLHSASDVQLPDGIQAIRRPDRQVRLARLVRLPTTDVIALDRVDATNVGRLLAASGTSDIANAHVVICARRSEQHIVTSDPDDLRVLDPTIGLIDL